MTDLKPGDVVVLTAGGPRMTVDYIRGDGIVELVWFMFGALHREAFMPEAIRKARFFD